ncbi:uncharacterized protein LOC134071222 isoform X2 [Sardina pilchardus]|uniref:uncharacterized protein LOC134071222 isoform X2 n=1 Tax=Sardina pilchardus TaxID=27697 RepID=UPI002E126FF0
MPGDEASAGTSQVMTPVFMGAPWSQKFSGVGTELKFRDWKQQLETMLSLQALNEQQKAAFVLSNLEGEARREILTLESADRDTPTKIFAALARLYGEITSIAALRTQFFNCRQESGQSLKSFSLRLRELFSRLKERRDGLANEDPVLRDQFIMGLKDDHVRRELRQQVRRNSGLSFADVWKEALALEEEQNDGWPTTSCLTCACAAKCGLDCFGLPGRPLDYWPPPSLGTVCVCSCARPSPSLPGSDVLLSPHHSDWSTACELVPSLLNGLCLLKYCVK